MQDIQKIMMVHAKCFQEFANKWPAMGAVTAKRGHSYQSFSIDNSNKLMNPFSIHFATKWRLDYQR